MNHQFQIKDIETGKDTYYIMYCSQCGSTYKYNGYRWDMIPFKSDEKPGHCNDEPLYMTDEQVRRLGGVIPEE